MADFPTNVPGPSYPIEKQMEPRIKKVEFGDGYTQQAPNGINYKLATWNLTWDALTTSEKAIIEAFLDGQGGYMSFNWTDPSGSIYKVKCPQWSVAGIEPNVYKMTATFKQSPI